MGRGEASWPIKVPDSFSRVKIFWMTNSMVKKMITQTSTMNISKGIDDENDIEVYASEKMRTDKRSNKIIESRS